MKFYYIDHVLLLKHKSPAQRKVIMQRISGHYRDVFNEPTMGGL